MTTVVYLGDRVLSDTRGSIQQEGFASEKGEKAIVNDTLVKMRTFSGGYMWDEEHEIGLVGFAGTTGSMRQFINFMDKLQCPMEQFLMTLRGVGPVSLFDLLRLEKPSSYLICLDNGQSIRLHVTKERHTYIGPSNKVKAIGSGSFYFDALVDVFHIDHEKLFRLAIAADPYSSKDRTKTGLYDKEDKTWRLVKGLQDYDEPLDVNVLVNGFSPAIKALFNTTLTKPKSLESEVDAIPDSAKVIIPPHQPSKKNRIEKKVKPILPV